MRTPMLFRRSSVLAFALSAASLGGCGQPLVSGQAQIDGRSQASTTLGALVSMSGTYTNCMVNSGSTWTAAFGTNGSGAPSVVQGDTACQLAITSVQDASTTYTATGSLSIKADGTFNGTAVKFTDGANAQNVFYADVMMLPANFATDFTLDFLHSSSPTLLPQTVTSQYQMRMATLVVDDSVPAPAYTLAFPAPPYLKDAQDKVLSLSSSAPTLSQNAGGQAAESYAILSGACPADPQPAYGMASTAISTALALSNFGIAVNMTISASVPLEQCLVAAHCDAGNSAVCSYQMFDVTFN